MKGVLIILYVSSLAFCELPPPLPHRGFRPSPQFQTLNNVPNSYLPPSQPLTALDVKIPSKLTIEQLISLTERLQSRPQKIQVNFPQQAYRPPGKLQLNQYRPPILGAPQSLYSVPNNNQQALSNQYGVPNKLQSSQNQQTLSSLYRPSNQLHSSQSQNVYKPPNNNLQFSQAQQGIPQTSYGTPARPQIPPATSYGVPDVKSIETLGEQQNSDVFVRQNGFQQQLPYPSSFSQFNPQNNQPSQNYLPVNEGGTNDGNIGQNYLPPQTTPRSVFTSKATTLKPPTVATTPTSAEGDYDYDQPTNITPLNENGSEAGPNVSISNAVAGGGNFFYLQQPDGRLQRVVLQKTQDPNNKPEEYVANYYFQNIQPLPNTMYAPLITLGGFTEK